MFGAIRCTGSTPARTLTKTFARCFVALGARMRRSPSSWMSPTCWTLVFWRGWTLCWPTERSLPPFCFFLVPLVLWNTNEIQALLPFFPNYFLYIFFPVGSWFIWGRRIRDPDDSVQGRSPERGADARHSRGALQVVHQPGHQKPPRRFHHEPLVWGPERQGCHITGPLQQVQLNYLIAP